MMDIIDKAQESDELFRRTALDDHFRRRRQDIKRTEPESDCRYCRDCGEEIEPERLEAVPGASRCIDCQGTIEKEADRGPEG